MLYWVVAGVKERGDVILAPYLGRLFVGKSTYRRKVVIWRAKLSKQHRHVRCYYGYMAFWCGMNTLIGWLSDERGASIGFSNVSRIMSTNHSR